MYPRSRFRRSRAALGLLGVISALSLACAHEAFCATQTILWNFGQGPGSSYPLAAVIMDKSGNLYGTTSLPVGGFSVVYELTPPSKGGSWTYSTLWQFNEADGSQSDNKLIVDAGGNLYGTTTGGACCYGDVFELSPPATNGGTWTETVLWTFDHTDGGRPNGLVMDGNGNLYGSTRGGGAFSSGVAFELSPPTSPGGAWAESTLWNFGSGSDGVNPLDDLIIDSKGNLYGTTNAGGSKGKGTVFELTPPASPDGDWTESVLWSFGERAHDGLNPVNRGGLVMDAGGNLYGTTGGGGTSGSGAAFELSPPSGTGGSWSESVLYSFKAKADPQGGLVSFGGNFYGAYGGDLLVYELSRTAKGTWKESIAYKNTGKKAPNSPMSNLIVDDSGDLYGTTNLGGIPGPGTVFELSDAPK